MGWNDKRVALLTELWAEGLSCTQIAMRLGHVTRNAVIGKVFRMGLPPRGRGGGSRRGIPKVRTVQAARRRAYLDTKLRKNSPLQALKLEPYVPQPEPFIEPSNRVPLLELTDSSCRWPIGDPKEPEFGFCNKERIKGLPYCEQHSRIAFRALNPTPPAAEQPAPAVVREKVAVAA